MKLETSFILFDDLILVDAIVVGRIAKANVQLVLDTGAALTTLAPSIAEAIGFNAQTSIKPTVTRTAAANEHGYLVQLPELTTLGVRVSNVYVNVADLGDIDGVLGTNFLFDFNLEIRPAERRILVERIAP